MQRSISQTTDSTLIVGVDIAKHNHGARAYDDQGLVHVKPFVILNVFLCKYFMGNVDNIGDYTRFFIGNYTRFVESCYLYTFSKG